MATPTPEPLPIKPGYKTTEFWLTAIAEIVGLLLASGAVSAVGEGTVPRIIGGVVAVLAALGYTVSRSKAKTGY